MSSSFLSGAYQVVSDKVAYSTNEIHSTYSYQSSKVVGTSVIALEEKFEFKTDTKVPKLGLMLVGWGGNNGSTVTAGIIANKKKMQWETKEGVRSADYVGSLTQASTVRLGLNDFGESVYIPFKNMLPMVEPNDIVLGGWDISSLNLAESMKRAKVLDVDLQKQLYPLMEGMVPLPSIYTEHYIAANQNDRADNVIKGTRAQQLEVIRGNIRDFKAANGLDKVVVLWTATTECCVDVVPGVNTTTEELMNSINVRTCAVTPVPLHTVICRSASDICELSYRATAPPSPPPPSSPWRASWRAAATSTAPRRTPLCPEWCSWPSSATFSSPVTTSSQVRNFYAVRLPIF
jgi:myo-inositol-1-phosphate synthase